MARVSLEGESEEAMTEESKSEKHARTNLATALDLYHT